jgi:hypothetical protein
MHIVRLARFAAVTTVAMSTSLIAATLQPTPPRTADGKPDMQGIWQASGSAGADLQDHAASLNMPAGRSVVVGGGAIPYQPWAAAKKAENFQHRQAEDPYLKCFLPGVPRVMTLDYPFQIFQTPKMVTMAFEWELEYRMIYTDGSKHPADDSFWMGDSRGHWEGDTLVVDVADINDKTWLDMAGDFHSDAMHVVERYHMTRRDTIQYEATIEDSKVFTKPWTISLTLNRRTDRDRLFEYVCEDVKQETTGAFTREDRTWYPGSPAAPAVKMEAITSKPAAPAARVANLRRTADGKPDIGGFYESVTRGANQGLERRGRGGPGRGPSTIIDPADGMLPMQPWAAKEKVSRNLTERGYDDPTAHCFPQGVPRSMYVPQGIELVQTPDYIVLLYERTSWRIVPLLTGSNAGRKHLPDSMRLWQGDSIGHWEGDTLVIDTTNFNGKTWLNEGGEIVSYAEHAVERFTPTGPDELNYEATVADPVVYNRPWTISFPVKREKFELREAACLEEEHDLPHLKALKDAAAAKK